MESGWRNKSLGSEVEWGEGEGEGGRGEGEGEGVGEGEMEKPAGLPDFDVVWEQPAVDGLRGMCHEHSSLEGGLGESQIMWGHMIHVWIFKKATQDLKQHLR